MFLSGRSGGAADLILLDLVKAWAVVSLSLDKVSVKEDEEEELRR